MGMDVFNPKANQESGKRVEVFNPKSNSVCTLPNMPMRTHGKSSMCENLLCGIGKNYKSCLRWENHFLFVKAPVVLVQKRPVLQQIDTNFK